MTATERRLRRDASSIFKAALAAADARKAVERHVRLQGGELRAGLLRLKLRDFDRVFVVAVGKAGTAMAAGLEEILGRHLTAGIVLTKHGHVTQRLKRMRVLEGAHPVPDSNGWEAARQIADLLRDLNACDLLVVAVSGGASALLAAPQDPITLAEKGKATDLLLRAGANIHELNAVRKHISFLKGGRMAALAYPATVVNLLLSDVIGDPLDVIGSGPTAPDPSTFAQALSVIEKYQLSRKLPRSVQTCLEQGQRGELPETPKPGDKIFEQVHNVVVGSNRLALEAASAEAKKLGYRPLILSSSIQGETREAATVLSEILREAVDSGSPVRPPTCLLAGGETTVTVKGQGKGGRNQEFALAAAVALDGVKNAVVLSGGTDGTDGPTDAAGAIASGDTVGRATVAGLSATRHLRENDAYPFFDTLGDLIRTGPTGTNVMDIHLLLAGLEKR